MSSTTKTKRPSDERITEVLTLISLGELEVADAAQALNLTPDELETIVSKKPELADAADTRAREIQANPERTLETSQRGLASIAATLTKRVQEQPHAMTVGEMVSAGSLLEKIAGVSEKRKLELKSEIDPARPDARERRLPLLFVDDRPNPVTGKQRLMIIMVPSDSPSWVDTSDPQFQTPHFDWVGHYLPLSPETGEPLKSALEDLTTSIGCRYLDSRGRQHGAHL
jgi:hypothetical protein